MPFFLMGGGMTGLHADLFSLVLTSELHSDLLPIASRGNDNVYQNVIIDLYDSYLPYLY